MSAKPSGANGKSAPNSSKGSAQKGSAIPKAKAHKLHAQLKHHLGCAILPGDTPLVDDALDHAAQFLLEAASQRTRGRHAITLEPDSGAQQNGAKTSGQTDAKRRLRIAIVNTDMPFLVDSIAATITAQGLSIEQLIHPVLTVERDEDGVLVALSEKNDLADGAQGSPSRKTHTTGLESLIYVETPQIDARQRRELLSELRVTLGDVRAAVSDWPKLRDTMARDAAAMDPDSEGAALLKWLNNGMLTQLGHLVRHRDGTTTHALGVGRKSAKQILAEASFERAFAWFDQAPAHGEKARARDFEESGF